MNRAPFTWRTPANTNEPTLLHAIRVGARRSGANVRRVDDLAPVLERVVAAMILLEIASASQALHSIRRELMSGQCPVEWLELERRPHFWFKDLIIPVERDVNLRAHGLRPRGLHLVHIDESE